MLIWLSIAVVVISHGLYLGPLMRDVRRGLLPFPIDLIGLSAVVFFDFGMLLEGCSVRYRSAFFAPVFDASQGSLILVVLMIAAAPWLMRLGASSWRPASRSECSTRLRDGRPRTIFYVLLAIACLGGTLFPLSLIALSPRFWESRALLGEQLGPGIILLSLPLYLLAFYVRLQDAKRRSGKYVVAFLVATATLAALAVGERTLVLLPTLIVLAFGRRFSPRTWFVSLLTGALVAALTLPLFKPNYSESGNSVSQLLQDTVYNDFYRAPELADTLSRSSLLGARTSYFGSGYVYAICLFLPRVIAPFKGEASAQQFTAQVMQQSPESLSWGFGISAMSEATFNGGILLAPLALILYGGMIGWLTRKAETWKVLEIPLCLAALWVFGYHLSALLLNFGAMAFVGMICEKLFTLANSPREGAHGTVEVMPL